MKAPLFLLVLAAIVLAALAVFLSFASWNAYAQHAYIGVVPHDRDTVTVAGEGKVTATPDIALLSLGVQTDAATVRVAQTENTQKMNAITSMLKQQGVADKDLTTSNYSIYPKINWNDGKQTIEGYTVSQSLSVKIRALDTVGDILSRAGDLGANQAGGIQFTIDDPAALRAEARGKAIDDARTKADALARQLGLTIIRPISFSESSGDMPPILYGRATDLGMGVGGAPSPDVQAGSQDVISSVNVIFQVQ